MQLVVPTTTMMQNLLAPMSNNLAMLQGPGGIFYTSLQVVVMLTSYSTESKKAMPYSKFAYDSPIEAPQERKRNDTVTVTSHNSNKQTEVSSRVGMLIIYTPALLLSALVSFTGVPLLNIQANMSLAGVLCLIHFIKRDVEVLFLHQYSGSTPLATASFIGFFYAINAALTCAVATATPNAMATQLGTLLFVIGIVGNLYHHYLLATLRNNTTGSASAKKKYYAPKGGLFAYVAAPHYLFELVGWLGIALASQHVNVYLVLGGMISYLAARAKRQNDWNAKTFSTSEWPASQRKNLVPFLF
jgi:protein-S-isoprenylcysteine O-methyltransferase Ste14